MQVIGEVERRRAARQVDDLAAGRERVDAVLEQFAADAVEEVLFALRGVARGRRALEGIEQAAGPLDLAFPGGVARPAFLVPPVCRDAEFGVLVHLVRADLHLDHAVLRADDSGVDRTVVVVLRRRDVVVELARDEAPAGVHDAERGIAVGHRAADDPQRAQVRELAELQLLVLHLPVDAVDVLGAAGDLGVDARGAQFLLQGGAHRLDVLLAVRATLVQRRCDAPVGLGLEMTEGEVLELPLEAPDAQPVGERREHGARLGGQRLALGRRRVAARAQPRQLDRDARHHQPWIAHHGEQHLAQCLGLRLLQPARQVPGRAAAEFTEAGEFAGEPRGLRAEQCAHRCTGQGVARQRLVREHRRRERRVVGQRTDEAGRSDAAFERRRPGALDAEAGARRVQRSLDRSRADLGGFHGVASPSARVRHR